MRPLRRFLTGTAVLLIVAQFGCAAHGARVAPPGSSSVSEADRAFCDASARAEADGIAGADPAAGASKALQVALHPVVVVNSMGMSLFAAPFVALTGATVKEIKDNRLRRKAYAYAMGPCLALVEQEQSLRPEDTDSLERGRELVRRYVRLAEISAAASAKNAGRAFERPTGPSPPRAQFGGPQGRPADRPPSLGMDYTVWAERDRAAGLALYQRALSLQERMFGADHPEIAPTLDGYAALLRTAHRDDDATTLEARALAIRSGQPEP